MNGDLVVRAENIHRTYNLARGQFARPLIVRAVDGVSFTLEAGKTLAVVGESGCGKSTLARVVTMIEPPSAGSLHIDGVDVTSANRATLRDLRRHVQIVFQDPYGSLNPRQKVGTILEEPLKIHYRRMPSGDRRAAALAMMARVGLRPEYYDRYPHMFSGGQRQRIAIARALMLRPRLLVLDEPVSALDLSVQAQVLNILSELQEEFGLAYLFISHALSVVRHMADRVLVMYLGRPVEYGAREEIFRNPRHPYTRALLSATPIADPGRPKERIKLEGELPSPINPPSGCPFHPRCPLAFAPCPVDRPDLAAKGPVEVACWAVDAAGNIDWTKSRTSAAA
jgi:dipeptide transport system ATP-binding protein